MSEKQIETTAPEIQINNVKELDQKLADAIVNNPNKPTEEEVEAAKIAFEEASKEFGIKSWDIGKPEDGERNVQYLIHFINNRIFWTEKGWMGVIKMMEEAKDAEKFIKANPGLPLKLGYQALEFMIYSLQKPGGYGYESAKALHDESQDYARVFDAIAEQVMNARGELKEIQILQDQYAAMQQGFYLEVEPSPENNETPQDEGKNKE